MKKIILIFFFISTALCFAREEDVKIHFIDIGEGDAILIQVKNECALIDTGNLLSGYKLVDYLQTNNVTAIKHLLITHPHLDHLSGAFFIIPKFKIGNFYDNGYNLNTTDDDIFTWYSKILRQNKNYKTLKEKENLKLGDITLEVLWPPEQFQDKNPNNNSLVIMLNYKGFRCLLAADIDYAIENELLKRNAGLAADVLKVAHHGAEDAYSKEFIKKLKPKFAIISVDKDNRRGYPAQRILDLLKAENITLYRTDKNGSITITVDDKSNYKIYSEK
ncbi:MAG: MBL fold metallo-hydrolase [Candidatus Omnitrophica bacterium]|nr:MBL fold metallo-hydrolase [Candidatus Omnitrophota bacterium]